MDEITQTRLAQILARTVSRAFCHLYPHDHKSTAAYEAIIDKTLEEISSEEDRRTFLFELHEHLSFHAAAETIKYRIASGDMRKLLNR